MGKKVKSEECNGRWCNRHLFSIKPFFFPNEHTKQESIRLCPKFNKTDKKLDCVLPLINLDKKFYTPLFTLQEDRKLYDDYDSKNRETFVSNQQLEEVYEKSEIVSFFKDNPFGYLPSLGLLTQMVPNQISKRYCRVCKDNFADYLEHIQSSFHREKSKSNTFNGYIGELANYFKSNSLPQERAEENTQKILLPDEQIKNSQSTLNCQKREAKKEGTNVEVICISSDHD